MAARKKGAISFGLVYIPIELYTATQDNNVRFNQLAKDTMSRVKYVKTCPDCKRELGPDDIVRGYQYEKGKYVVVSDEELDSIKTDADKAIKITQFVDKDEVPPVYFNKSYQVIAQEGGEKALELLRQAMLKENKIAIGTTVMGNSETTFAIVPYEEELALITLYYESEVKELPTSDEHPNVDDAELKLAQQLVSSMEAEFDPSQYKDTYQEKLHELIHSKIAGEKIVVEKKGEQPENIINLMDALTASLNTEDDKKKTPAKTRRKKKAS